MSDRLRAIRQSATDSLTRLLREHGEVAITNANALYTVRIGANHFDAGTVEDALNSAFLETDCTTRVASDVLAGGAA